MSFVILLAVAPWSLNIPSTTDISVAVVSMPILCGVYKYELVYI